MSSPAVVYLLFTGGGHLVCRLLSSPLLVIADHASGPLLSQYEARSANLSPHNEGRCSLMEPATHRRPQQTNPGCFRTFRRSRTKWKAPCPHDRLQGWQHLMASLQLSIDPGPDSHLPVQCNSTNKHKSRVGDYRDKNRPRFTQPRVICMYLISFDQQRSNESVLEPQRNGWQVDRNIALHTASVYASASTVYRCDLSKGPTTT